MGTIYAAGQSVNFNISNYREIVFRFVLGGSNNAYHIIPLCAIGLGATSEICMSEGVSNVGIAVIFTLTASGITVNTVVSSWSSWAIEILGIN